MNAARDRLSPLVPDYQHGYDYHGGCYYYDPDLDIPYIRFERIRLTWDHKACAEKENYNCPAETLLDHETSLTRLT